MIQLGNDPQEYGLPFPSWRPGQRDACERTLNLEPGGTLMLEQPTGAGKSGLPALVSHFRPGATVLLRTTDLQSQYTSTLPVFKSIWGQGRLPNICVNPDHISTFQSVYGSRPFRSECKYKKPNSCPQYCSCPYEVAKAECISARAKVLNCSYARYARWWRELLTGEVDLFLDEAHNLPTVLSGLVAIQMDEGYRRRYNLPPFPLAKGGAPIMLKKAAGWASAAEAALLPLTKTDDIKLQRRAKNKRAELGEFAAIAGDTGDAEWYIESTPGDRFFARPVVPGPYSRLLLDEGARSTILMSATIGGEKGAAVLAKELAIEEYEFVSYPHIFPKENRPVYFAKNAPRMSYSSTDKDYQRQVELMVKALKNHPDQKGLIHTASWKHAERITNALRKSDYRGIVFLPRGDRVQAIEKFKKMQGAAVAVSPSWKEGLSFDDDLCRFSIIAKTPFPSFADPVVKLRAKREGGRGWIDWITALAVVQAAGRGVRSETDFATTYILDGNWTRVARMAPDWFEWEKVTL